MSTFSDYLNTPVNGFLTVVASAWVKLTNNDTAVNYISTGASDPSTGKFTVNNIPPGTYTVYTGLANTGPWTATADTNFVVPLAPSTAGSTVGVFINSSGDIAGRSLTIKAGNGPYLQSALSIALAATGASVVEGQVWLPEPSGGDDLATIQAIFTAIAATGRWIAVWGWPATYRLSGLLTVPNGIGLQGEAGYFSTGGLNFLCTAAAAGVSFGDTTTTATSGPLSGGFQVDGNNVATSPLRIGKCVRVFRPMAVVNAAAGGAGALIQKAQNCEIDSLSVQNCAGDGVVLDLGCGGNVFNNMESNNNAGWNLRFTQSAASADVYSVPTQNFFTNPRIERSKNAVLCEAGLLNLIDQAVVEGNDANPHTLVQMTYLGPYNTSVLTMRNTFITGTQTVTTGFDVAANCVLNLLGETTPAGMLVFLTVGVGATVEFEHLGPTSSVTTLFAGAGGQDLAIRTRYRSPLDIKRSGASDQFIAGSVAGEAGGRMTLTPTLLKWGDGSGFTFDAGITRSTQAGAVCLNVSGILGQRAGLYVGLLAKVTTYNITDADYFVTGDCTSASFSITLLTAVGRTGKVHGFKRIDGSANHINIATTSAQTIDGAASPYVLTVQWQTVWVISDGANWLIYAKV